MNKIDWVRKLTSRKFWLSIASFVAMLMVALGQTEASATQVTSLIMAGATVIGYVIGDWGSNIPPLFHKLLRTR